MKKEIIDIKQWNTNNPQTLLNTLVKSKKTKLTKQSANLEEILTNKYMLSKSLEHLEIECDGFNEDYKSYFIQLVSDILEQYPSPTVVEKTLINRVAGLYVRIQSLEGTMYNCIAGSTITKDIAKIYSIFGKELDRTNKLYLETIRVLQSFRQKSFNVTIKSQNTLIGDNKQMNVLNQDKLRD